MTWQIFFTVFTFGGIGAVVRGLIMYILAASALFFPIAIVLVNVLAAFLGAFIINMALPNDLQISMVAGFVGGLGTLSAIPGNIYDLIFQHGFRRLAVYFALTIFLSLGGAYVGGALGSVAHIQAQKWSGQYDTIEGLKSYKETLEASKADLEHEMHVHEEYARELEALSKNAKTGDLHDHSLDTKSLDVKHAPTQNESTSAVPSANQDNTHSHDVKEAK